MSTIVDKRELAVVSLDLLPYLEAQAKERQATSEPGLYGGKPLAEIMPHAVSQGEAREHAVVSLNVLPYLEAQAKERQGERNDLTSVNSLTEVPKRAAEEAAPERNATKSCC